MVRAPVAEGIDPQGLVALPIPPITSSESYPKSLYIGKPIGVRGDPGEVLVAVIFQPIKLREYPDSTDLKDGYQYLCFEEVMVCMGFS